MKYSEFKFINLFAILLLNTLVVLGQNQSKYKIHQVEKGETLESISKKHNVSKEILNTLNPDLKNGIKKGNIIIIPKDTSYISSKYISAKNDTSNNLTKTSDKYLISKDNSSFTESISKPNKNESTNAEFIFHIVKPKETIFSLSRKYNVSMDQIYEFNKFLEGPNLKIGDTLKVPNITPSPMPEGYTEYSVKKSEGLWRISKNFDMTIEELKKINPSLENGLKEGMVIYVKKKKKK